jgi:hypothetical protein
MQVRTQQQQREERRKAKLEHIQQQVDEGTLVIRKMTPAERVEFPRRDGGGKRRPFRGR